MGEITEKDMQSRAGAVYALILNRVGFSLTAIMYGGLRLGQWSGQALVSSSRYLSAQSVAAGRYACEAAQNAYLHTSVMLYRHPRLAYEATGFFTGFGISGPPPGSYGGIAGHVLSMREDYSRQLQAFGKANEAAFDAFLDYVSDPEEP